MRDMNRDARCFADRDGLVDRLEQPAPFVADVRGVDAAVAPTTLDSSISSAVSA